MSPGRKIAVMLATLLAARLCVAMAHANPQPHVTAEQHASP